MQKEYYVLGFMFSEDKKQVALIKKQRPNWQLNGIGGMVKEGEQIPLTSIIREFEEKTGYNTIPQQWKYYAELHHDEDFHVDCFCCIGDLQQLKSTTDEEVVIKFIDDISFNSTECVEYVITLIALAIENLPNQKTFTSINF